MEGFKKCMALLAITVLLLLSLFSGLISATSAGNSVKGEEEQTIMPEVASGAQVEGLGEGLSDPEGEDPMGEGESLEPREGEESEAPPDGALEEGDDEGKPSQGEAGENSNANGDGEEDGIAPSTVGGLLSTPGPAAGDDVATPEGGSQLPEVTPFTSNASVTPETVDPWQSGNAQSECQQAGCRCPYAYKIDDWGENGMDGSYDTGVGNTITISGSDGYRFDWSSPWPVCCVIVKGGTGANIFRYGGAYGDGGLYAPSRPAGSPGSPTYGISHVTFCFGPCEDERGSISGTKWEDEDCDGKGDKPVDGVTIILRDAKGTEVGRVQTSNGGVYSFGNLDADDYTVLEDLSVGGLDGDWYAENPLSGSHAVTLAQGQDIEGMDFINARLARIFGFKFFDQDCDGRWDQDEPRLEGVTIELWKDGELLSTAVTDEKGDYAFEDLKPGKYKLREVVEEGWHPTTPNPVWVKVKCGEEEEVRFGNMRLGTVHGYKFLDEDCDGVMDEGEEGIPGVRVVLKSICGVKETWTDENGHYRFEGLWPGLYKVVLDASTVPAGHYHTTKTWKLLWLCCCETERVDFGNARYLTISGAKLDCHGEPVPGVVIELRQGDAILETDTTDENGEYSFGDLLPGTYTVKEALTEEQLEEWYAVYPEGGIYEDLQLACGQDIENLDFHNARYGSICGAKWEDLDGDAEHGDDEPPVEGVLIQLWRMSGSDGVEASKTLALDGDDWTLEGEDTTAEDGSYCFRGLKPGIYRVVEALSEEQLEEWFAVAPKGGVHESVELACGRSLTGLDFLNARYGSVSGYKYEDLDADGELDEGEPGFAGVTIVLKQGETVIDTVQTGADGSFSFADLEPGAYDIEEVLDAGVLTKSATVIAGVAVISGQETVLEEEYFLNYRLGSITGYKYLDADADGSLDEGEKPWDGSANPVTIELLKEGEVVKSFVIKDDGGMYFFDGLEPGIYSVREAQPFPQGMKSKAPTSVTVLVTSGSEVVLDPENYFLNYLEPEVAPEVITPPVAPQVQPELTGQLPTTGADHMPLFLVSGMLVLLGMSALVLGILRSRLA